MHRRTNLIFYILMDWQKSNRRTNKINNKNKIKLTILIPAKNKY